MADSPLDNPEVVLFNGDTIPLDELSARMNIATGGDSYIFQAKGDLLVGTGPSTGTRLPVGPNNQSLVADDTAPLGLTWKTPDGTGNVVGPTIDVVDSHVVLFNGPTGEVIKTAGMTLTQPTIDHVAAADPHPQYALDADFLTAVRGPASSVLNNVATFADGSGKVIKDSGVLVTTNQLVFPAANAAFEIGSNAGANTPYVDFHSSGLNSDFDSRIYASGGTAATGTGVLSVYANTITFKTWSGTGDAFRILPSGAAGVDYLTVAGSATGGGGNPVLGAAGASTNIHIVLQPKGTGAIRPSPTGTVDMGMATATWNHVYSVFLNGHTIPAGADTLALLSDLTAHTAAVDPHPQYLLPSEHTDASLVTSDITTNDTSTGKHGFAPKLSGVGTQFLSGVGTWIVPTPSAFPAGTVMGFFNTTAPVGWVQLATHDNKAVRIANTASGGSSGGSMAFTSAFGLRTTSGYLDNATFDSNYNGSHAHASSAQAGTSTTSGGASGTQAALAGSSTSWVTGYSGGGWGHAHTYHGSDIDMRVQYVDMILATKS